MAKLLEEEAGVVGGEKAAAFFSRCWRRFAFSSFCFFAVGQSVVREQ